MRPKRSSSRPRFASTRWYSDFNDPRCPHDAWLGSVEICETGRGRRQERRSTAISLRLLGAFHDGNILFRYDGVARHSLEGRDCADGMGDWLRDEFSRTPEGNWIHRITWAGSGTASNKPVVWEIAARRIVYKWVPASA